MSTKNYGTMVGAFGFSCRSHFEAIKEPEECACEECIQACKGYPGWFAPGEAENAAKNLGIEFSEFEKNLILDHCDNQSVDNAPYIYSPRKINVDLPEEKIRVAYKQRTKGVCVFLKNDRCSIHEHKPYECRHAYGCKIGEYRVRENLEEKWIEAGAPLGMRPEN